MIPKGNSVRKTRHTTYRWLRSVHQFIAQLTLLTSPPKSYAIHSRLRDFCNEFDNFVSTAGRQAWNFVVDVRWQIFPNAWSDLFNRPDTAKVPFHVGASTPRVMHVPLTHVTQHPKLHLDRLSYFCTAHNRDRKSTFSL